MKNLIQEADKKLLDKVSELYETPIEELAMIMPRAYDISAQETNISSLELLPDKTKVMLKGTLTNFRVKPTSRFTFIYADLHDTLGNKQICQWASSNKAASAKMMILQSDTLNKRLQINAAITSFAGQQGRVVFLSNPKYDEIEEFNSNTLMSSPIYQLKGSIKIFEIKRALSLAIGWAYENKYAMDRNTENKLGLMPLEDALEYVHGNRSVNSADIDLFVAFESEYHKRIRYEKIFRILKRLKNDKTAGKSPIINYSIEKMREIESALPFELTSEQKKALGGIFNTFKSGMFKSILLQGDVGSGKTATSIFASASVSQAGYQVAVLAPSAVLATQLHDEFKELLEPVGIEVLFLAGKVTKKARIALQKKVDKNPNLIVIGTTAVNNLEFSNLGLVIIDEEQKFGVEAKRALLQGKAILPYQIYMSATPLPRSIQSSIYGNFEIIRIASKPAGRIDVVTKIINNQEAAQKVFNFIEAEANRGRASLIVAPSINSGELASIEKISKICSERFGDDFFKVIHGQQKEKEINDNIQAYRENKFPLMLSTTMVEAGFSHKDLSVVLVTGVDRFGSAQLHQMRGRAGRRAGLRGYCALMDLDFIYKPKVRERLEYFCTHHDGFDLANKDLQLRGSGDLTGKAQSGGEINFVEYSDEVEMIKKHIT